MGLGLLIITINIKLYKKIYHPKCIRLSMRAVKNIQHTEVIV